MAVSLSVSASASLAVSRSRILSVFSLAETEAPSSAFLMALMSSASDVLDFIKAAVDAEEDEDEPGDGENPGSWTVTFKNIINMVPILRNCYLIHSLF